MSYTRDQITNFRCTPNPCQNDATCERDTTDPQVYDKYTCSCIPGFVGEQCETECEYNSVCVLCMGLSLDFGSLRATFNRKTLIHATCICQTSFKTFKFFGGGGGMVAVIFSYMFVHG